MKASELVLAPNGSLYHIRLDSSTLADKVLLVGNPTRVDLFKNIFDSIEFENQYRELRALTGRYHGTRMTVLSTGMGCDNIDIVMTELDAALRVENGEWKEQSDRRLQVVRIGTSGSLQADVDCGSHVASAYAIGLDGLMNYYREWETRLPEMEERFVRHLSPDTKMARPYCVKGSEMLLNKIGGGMHHGITATAPGFYGPQGRTIRLHPAIEDVNEKLSSFGVTNFEMETSAIYGFSQMLGHEALTVCLIIANRAKGTFLNEYYEPMRELVGTVMERFI